MATAAVGRTCTAGKDRAPASTKHRKPPRETLAARRRHSTAGAVLAVQSTTVKWRPSSAATSCVHSTAQHSTAQHSTAQHSIAQARGKGLSSDEGQPTQRTPCWRWASHLDGGYAALGAPPLQQRGPGAHAQGGGQSKEGALGEGREQQPLGGAMEPAKPGRGEGVQFPVWVCVSACVCAGIHTRGADAEGGAAWQGAQAAAPLPHLLHAMLQSQPALLHNHGPLLSRRRRGRPRCTLLVALGATAHRGLPQPLPGL